MPIGKITKLVHLSAQASRLQNTALVPTRNTVGYGLIETVDGEQLYFDADGAHVAFEDLRVGQSVEYERDKQFAIASTVQPTNHVAAAAIPQKPSAANAEPPAKAKAQATAAPRPKKGEEAPTLVLSSPRQCLFVARYEKVAPGRWRRVGTLAEIETYTTDVADQYSDPVLSELSPTRAMIRVYDERAVNLLRVTDFLGDPGEAQQRCDRALLSHFAGDELEKECEPLARW